MKLRPSAPGWGYLPAFVCALVCVLVLPASAQPKGKTDKPTPAAPDPAPSDAKAEPKLGDGKDGKKKGGTKTFDFTALDLNGRMRSPQLLYFLERANEELERASLEQRSFIPHMVRSLEDEAL